MAAQNATGSATFIAYADLDEARAVNAQLALMPHHDVSTAEGLAQIRIAFAPPGASVLRPAEVMIDGPGGPLFFERNDPWLHGAGTLSRAASSANVKSVTDASFAADVLDSSIPVLVDFWAAWCGPCKMMAPMLADLSDEFASRVAVAKVNIEDSPGTTERYGISSVPTMIIFSDGKPVKTMVGARPRAALVRELSTFL